PRFKSAIHLGGRQAEAGPVVLPGRAPLLRGAALRFDLLDGAEAPVRLPLLRQPVRQRAVRLEAARLEERPLVPVDAEPLEPFQYGAHALLGGALQVGVLDAQDE